MIKKVTVKRILAILSIACLFAGASILISNFGMGIPHMIMMILFGWGGFLYGVGVGMDIEEESERKGLDEKLSEKQV